MNRSSRYSPISLAALALSWGLVAALVSPPPAEPQPSPAEPVEVVLHPPGGDAGGAGAVMSFAGSLESTLVAWPPSVAPTLNPEQARIVSYLQALAEGEPATIASHWAPAERDTLRERLEPGILERSRSFVTSIRQVCFLGHVDYGPYRIVLAELGTAREPVPRAYPLLIAGTERWVTDRLSGDVFYSTLGRTLARRLAEGEGGCR